MTRIENINTTIKILQNEIHRLKSEITELTIDLNKTKNGLTSIMKENTIEDIESIISILNDAIFDLIELK